MKHLPDVVRGHPAVFAAGILLCTALLPAAAPAGDVAGWSRTFSRPLPAAEVEASNLVWRVDVEGNTRFDVPRERIGHVTFTNIVVDVDLYPVMELDVPAAAGTWKLYVGEQGGSLSNVYTATQPGHVRLNVANLFGWSGAKAITCRFELEDASSGTGEAIRFDLGAEAEKDVVFESGLYATSSVFGASPLYSFVEDGRYDGASTANGLPTNRILTSRQSELGQYRLLPYGGPNVIELPTSVSAPAESHVIDVPDRRYSRLGLLVSAEGGNGSFTLTLNYRDGGAVTNWFEADDWYQLERSGTQAAVITNMDLAFAGSGLITDANHFNLYEFSTTDLDTNRVLDSITIGNDPNRWPSDQARFGGVFAINGRSTTTNTSFLEVRELRFTAARGWDVFDAFDTHHWVSRYATPEFGKFEPFDPYYDGWKQPAVGSFSTAHPVEGDTSLKVRVPITPAARFNWCFLEVELPEAEDWSAHKILTFDPYMEDSPLGLPLVGLIVENATGGVYRVPLILGWQLFQWENRQMTWPLQGNVAAGEVNGVQQWQIPPIPMDYLTNVTKVSCGFEYYYDPELSETYVHMDNMRLGATQMWDSFNGPDHGWYGPGGSVKVGIGRNRTLDSSAGSLCIRWPAATNYVFARTAAGGWQHDWRAYSHARIHVWAEQAGTQIRLLINGSATTTVAAVSAAGEWVPVTWNLPAGVTTVSSVEIGIMSPSAGGKVYVDRMELASYPSRIESARGRVLRDSNELTWTLSDTAGVAAIRVVYGTNAVPATATNGALVTEVSANGAGEYTAEHTAPANGRTYFYGLFIRYTNGSYSPLVADASVRLSRDLLMAGGAGSSYEAAFSKENGALMYVHDNSTGQAISYGNEAEDLWRVIFAGEQAPDLQAARFSADDASMKFSFSESPLVLQYAYLNGGESLALHIAVDDSETNRFRMRLAITNDTLHAIRTVEAPRRLSFAVTNVNRVAFPIQEGMAFTREFFLSGRYTIQPRPWLFADFIGLDSTAGRMSFYAIQDSFYGADILPRHDPAKPVFQPANIGVGASMDMPGQGFMDYEMVTYIPAGGRWSSPTLVLESGGASIRDALAHYKGLNGFNDTNRYPTLKQKLDKFGLFDKVAGSPVMAIECEKVVNWKKAAPGELWSTVQNEWLDQLPRDNILHFTHWQHGILEDEHPDCQPIAWEKYGSYNDLTNLLGVAHQGGWLVMPFANWTVWNKPDVVRRDSQGALLPVPEATLKVSGSPFYEYNGYMVKPWHDEVYNVHSNMMMFYRTNQPMDTMFVDMTCERTWRYTRVDTNSDGTDETIFTGYTAATIDHNNYLKQFFPLYTEGVMDQMMGEVTGYCQTHRQKMMMDILRHVGDEFTDWNIFPLAADVAHDHVGFYQHDLNLQVFPRTKPLLTHYTAMGYCYIVDVATWYGEVDAEGLNWMNICDDFQKGVVAKYFGQALNQYDGAVGGDGRRIRTSFGSGTNEVTVLANLRDDAEVLTNGYTISRQGFMATQPDDRLIAGVFRGTFSGAALATGDHYIVVERLSDDAISVRHPGGVDTEISIPKPAGWTGEVAAVYVLRDATELAAPGHVTVSGDHLVLSYTKESAGGSPVVGYRLIHLSAQSPVMFLSVPTFETANATQVWVLARANKPVTVSVHYGRSTPDEAAVTNLTLSLTHAVLVTLPSAGEGYYFRVVIRDEFGQTAETGRIYYPAAGMKYAADFAVRHVDIGGAANKDIVYNSGDSANDAFGGPGNTLCFLEDGWTDSINTGYGLPVNRQIASGNPQLGTYQLLPYGAPNVIELVSTGRMESHTFPLPASAYKRIGFLGAAVDGDVSLTLLLHYEDGSVTTNWFALDDWWKESPRSEVSAVWTNMNRAVAATGEIDPYRHFQLFEFVLDSSKGLDEAKVLTGITIADGPNRWSTSPNACLAVFAVNAEGQTPSGWRDRASDAGLVCQFFQQDGHAVVAIDGASTPTGYISGKVLSPKSVIDLDRFPILDVAVSQADQPALYYQIGMQEEVPPFRYVKIFGRTESAHVVADMAKISGWGGPRSMSIAIDLVNNGTNGHSIQIDRFEIRADRTAGWQDEFDPPLASWRDDTADASYNAQLEDAGGGLARLRENNETNWGHVDSELLALDLEEYPWASIAVSNIDVNAGVIAGIQYQTPPYDFTTIVSGISAPYERSQNLDKGGSEPLDLMRAALVIEGSNKAALVDNFRLQKRLPGKGQLVWNRAPASFKVAEGGTVWAPYTAMDYEGNPIEYGAARLPPGASYDDGIFRWSVGANPVGTYSPVFYARNGKELISRTVSVTVTNSLIQLVAPRWSEQSVDATSMTVRLAGRYIVGSTNEFVEVSVDGGGYSTTGVSKLEGSYVWSGTVTGSPALAQARLHNTSNDVISSSDRCDVYQASLGPAFLSAPVIERESATSTWVRVRAAVPVGAMVRFGRAAPDESSVSEANLSVTHALRVQTLQAGWSYWFQVIITDAQGRSSVSDPIYYPVGGAFWVDDFTGSIEDWRDSNTHPEYGTTTVSNEGGLAYFRILPPPPGDTNEAKGKVLSPVMTADLDQFPILELSGARMTNYTVGNYRVGLQQEEPPYDFATVVWEERPATMILNIPQLTGWTGTKKFSVEITMFNPTNSTQEHRLYVDYMMLRSDGNAAWEESFDPQQRIGWLDQTEEPTFHSELEDLGDGTAQLSQAGVQDWGEIRSEILILDMNRYPWFSAAVRSVDENANFKVDLVYELPPHDRVAMTPGLEGAPYLQSGRLSKNRGETLDRFRVIPVIEGALKKAVLDQLSIVKRRDGDTLAWDSDQFSFKTGMETVAVAITATDFGGNPVTYTSRGLPEGATYNGIVEWANPVAGTWWPELMASNGITAITNNVAITVTNSEIQLESPKWRQTRLDTTNTLVTMEGTFLSETTNVVVEVSVNGAAYTIAAVTQTNGTFSWSGTLTGLSTVAARKRDTADGRISAAHVCDVNRVTSGGPSFLAAPVFETETATSLWMFAKSYEPVAVRLFYGPNHVNEYSLTDPTLSMTHAVHVQGLNPAKGYWFQVVITDAGGESSVSDIFYYPASGVTWAEGFTSDAAGWKDASTEPAFDASLSVSGGKATITVGGRTNAWDRYGKVLSPVMSADVDRTPILEVEVTQAGLGGAYYGIALQRENSSERIQLFAEQRAATTILNIPQLTGWHGTNSFMVEFFITVNTNVSRSIVVDSVQVRSDRDLAWADPMNPRRAGWYGESVDGDLNAELVDLGNGMASLRQVGGGDWGHTKSEMLVMDLGAYPWLSADVADVDLSANCKVNIQYELPPHDFPAILPGNLAVPYEQSGKMQKNRPDVLDQFRVALVIEGAAKTAAVDQVRILRRPPGTTFAWDNSRTSFKTGAGSFSLALLATDFAGLPVTYGAESLPAGATYNGILAWSSQAVGTHWAKLIASNGVTAITNEVAVTVTNSAIQLETPLWEKHEVQTNAASVTIAGIYQEKGAGILLEVSVNGAAYSTQGVSQAGGAFSWSGLVEAPPMTLDARVRDTATARVSATDPCLVYNPEGGPSFLRTPWFEIETATSIWVHVGAEAPASVRLDYGRSYPNEATITRTNRSLTHAILVQGLDVAQDYWFRISITDSDGRSTVSSAILFKAGGVGWAESFDGTVTGWHDKTTDPDFGQCTFSVSAGRGVFTLPGTTSNVYGKVLSPGMTVDIERYPILEAALTKADYAGAGYEIGLQELVSPWRYARLFGDSRSGTMILNIPQLSGWTGAVTFAVSFSMSSADSVSRSMEVDSFAVRADRNVAWADEMNPPRSSWIGENQNTNYNAVLEDLGNGTARLREVGDDVWGQVQSEMLVLDLAQYPWITFDVDHVDASAGAKAAIQYQTPPYVFTAVIARTTAPFEAAAAQVKTGTNELDMIRASLVIEGLTRTARVDAIRFSKHTDSGLLPIWDRTRADFKIGVSLTSAVPFTATDYRGGAVAYSSVALPPGATYDGIFRWAPVWPQIGTFRPTFIASNEYGEIRRQVTITVTNEFIQLVAPMWNAATNNVRSNTVTLGGTYWFTSTNEVLQVSVSNNMSYRTVGLSVTNDGAFTWSGTVDGLPTPVYVRASNRLTGCVSGDELTEVFYLQLLPSFLGGRPVFETENSTQVWVLTRSDDPVSVGIAYGTASNAAGPYVAADTNRWMTHATLISGLVPTQAYWFRVSITNAGGYVAVSSNLFYPARGAAWEETFSGGPGGWFTNNVLRMGTNGSGQGIVTIPGTQTWGTVETLPVTVDLDQFPVFEMSVTAADHADAGYVIILKNQSPPYDQPILFQDTRAGTMVLNIPEVLGWTGVRTFAIAIGMSSGANVDRSIAVDYLTLRADRNVAWEESCSPLRTTWVDEVDNPDLNAFMEDNGNGTARVRHSGQETWGQVRSEMLFLNVTRYPWASIGGTGVDFNATVKMEELTQSLPYTNLNMGLYRSTNSTEGYAFEGRMKRFDTNAIVTDLLRLMLVIEGSNQSANVDQVRVAKRPVNATHALCWDFVQTEFVFDSGKPVEIPFTATDYEGGPVTYQAINLPPNATYDGVFRWTPAPGTYAPAFVAANGYGAITSVISMTVTSIYTVHLAYDESTGTDSFPATQAEQSNYTGAASIWMVGKYLKGGGFTNSQSQIYNATTHDPNHNSEITAPSCASYQSSVIGTPYYFSTRSRTTLDAAMRETVYWIDYQPPGGKQAPVSILTGTNWSYKVVRGFQTDLKPYNNGYAPGTNFTLFGVWMNDPKVAGLGNNLYVPATNLQEVYLPSDASGNYQLVAEPPQGADFEKAAGQIDRMSLNVAPAKTSASMAAHLQSLFGGRGAGRRLPGGASPQRDESSLSVPVLWDVLPTPLQRDRSFKRRFDLSVRIQEYAVNEDDPQTRYVLVASGLRGPATTTYVLKMNPNDGSGSQATWIPGSESYPPVPRNAAIWVARRRGGQMDAEVVSAKLVFDHETCVSQFLPTWRIELRIGGSTHVFDVRANTDLRGDSDGDGMSDGDELYVGSDPQDPQSTFDVNANGRASRMSPAGNSVVLTWSSVTNRVYGIHRATSLKAGFSRIASGVPATPPLNTYTDQPPSDPVYYRIEAE